MKISIVTVIVSFCLNILWENFHAHLYLKHLGEKINEKTLIIATLGDVVILSFFVVLWWYIPLLRKNFLFVIPFGLIVAFAIEKYVLMTNRWEYSPNMPIVPFLDVGLSPIMQISVTSLILILILRQLL